MWAQVGGPGQAAGLIDGIEPAGVIVARVTAEAEQLLRERANAVIVRAHAYDQYSRSVNRHCHVGAGILVRELPGGDPVNGGALRPARARGARGLTVGRRRRGGMARRIDGPGWQRIVRATWARL